MAGDDEAVAAVVAGSADDRDAGGGCEALPDLVGGGKPGPLHQHRAGQTETFDGRVVEGANLVRVVEGKQSAHGSCTIATAPAIPRECVIERSIAPAPSRSARSATSAGQRDDGLRPAGDLDVPPHELDPASRSPSRRPPCRRSGQRSAGPDWAREAVGALALGEHAIGKARALLERGPHAIDLDHVDADPHRLSVEP